MSRSRKLLLGATGVLLALGIAFTWLIATESGARWAIARAEPLLPEALTIGPVGGTLLGGLDAGPVEWNEATANVVIERVFVDVRILPLLSRRVYVDRLDVSGASVEIAATEDAPAGEGGLPEVRLPVDLRIMDASFTDVTIQRAGSVFAIDTVDVVGNMRGSDLELSEFRVDGETFALDVAAQARLAGDYPATANLTWRLTGDPDLAGRLRISGDIERYEIEHTLELPVDVASTGSVSVDADDISVDLQHVWQAIEWDIGERQLDSDGGMLTTAGTPDSIAVTLDTSARIDALPDTRIALQGSVAETGLRIDEASLRTDIGRLDLSGNVLWAPEIALDFRLSELDPTLASELLAGELGASGTIEASLADGALRASVRVDELDGQVNGSDVAGSATVDWADNELTVTDGQLAIGENRVAVEGNLGETLAIGVDFAFDDLAQALADADGSFGGRIEVAGRRDAPELRLNASGADLELGNYGLGRIAIDSTLRPDGLSIVDVRASGLSIRGETVAEVEASVSGNLEQHRLSFFAAADGAELAIGAVGGLADDRWRGEIAEFDIDSELFGDWALDAASPLALAADSLELGELCVVSASTDGRVCAGANTIPGGESNVNVEIDSLPVAALPLGLPETTRIDGNLDARIGISVADGLMNGTGSIGIRGGKLTSNIDGEELTVSFAEAVASTEIVDNRGEAAVRFALDGGGGSASIDMLSANVFDLDAAIEGQATLSLADADVFAFLLPAVTDPYGDIEGALRVDGSLTEPEFAGALTLKDGRFAVRRAGIVVTDVTGRIEQRSTGRLRLSGSGRSGDGAVTIEGETVVGAETGIRSEVRITGENFELLRLPDWQLAASPNVDIVFDDRSAVVTGTLDIPRAAITVRRIPESAVSASPDVVVHRQGIEAPTSGRRIAIDVDVSLGEDISFSGFGLETGLEGALRVQGGTDAPYTGVGRLTLSGGRYEAYGQELDIELGNLIFNGPLDEPQLDVRAVRRTGDVTAGIMLTGTPEQLNSELVIDPAMSDAEALSYLLTGRPLESATDAGEGDTLNQAAFALGLSGAGAIVSQIRGDLGLDTLSVEGGSSGGRIVAGKQFGERLFVEYGYGLIDQLGELLLRYQLNDRLILESRTGSVSNLDLVYSVKKE